MAQDRFSIIKWAIIFPTGGILFPVRSLERLLKLCHLKLQCVNAQLNKKLMTGKRELSVKVFYAWCFSNIPCYRNEIWPFYDIVSFLFFPWKGCHFCLWALNRVPIASSLVGPGSIPFVTHTYPNFLGVLLLAAFLNNKWSNNNNKW